MATVSRRKSGWQAQVRKLGYQPVSKCFDKKSDAEAWARHIESNMDRAVYVDRSEAERTTLGDLLGRYVDQVTSQKKGAIPERYRILSMRKHPLSLRFLATLTAADFAAYRDSRLREVSGSTVNKELKLLAHVFEVARRDWGIPIENPARAIRRPKINPSRERRLQVGEVERILAASESPTLAQIVHLAIETAMRRGEIANMRWEHVNLAERVLRIPETKTGFSRTIPLSTKACQVISALARRIDGWVFGLESQSITQAFDRACERAGIKNLRFHDLRHEATSRLFEKNLNPMQVSAITGHRTLEMLKRYTHLKPQDLAALLR